MIFDRPLRVVELFAGIGAQAMALERLGIPHECTVCEIDVPAYRSYCAIHGDAPNLGDITQVESLPDADLVTYSFPCQDLSIAGNQSGMEEGSGTRSALVWEVGRLLDVAKENGNIPAMLVMENVPAILNEKNYPEFKRWMDHLRSLGYQNSVEIRDAKDFGVPQSRKRCFMVSSLDGRTFRFPRGFPLEKRLRDVLEDDVPESYYLSDEKIAKYESHRRRQNDDGFGFGWKPSSPDDVSPTVLTSPTKGDTLSLLVTGTLPGYEKNNRVYDVGGPSPTLNLCRPDHSPKIEVVGDLNLEGRHEQINRVYGPDGISPTLCSMTGGGIVPKLEVPSDQVIRVGDLNTPMKQASEVISVDGISTCIQAGFGKSRNTITEIEVDPSEIVPMMDEGDVCAMLTPGRDVKRQQGPRFREDTAFCLNTQDRHGIASVDNGALRIRYLSERECWRLMGFPDHAFDRAKAIGTSKTNLYKQAGNSIVVDVLMAIFKGMYIDNSWVMCRSLEDW